MFTEKVELKDFEMMAPEYQDLLKRVLAIQADCEIGGPHLYVEDMLPSAPTRVDRLIVARTAAEEVDHYRKMARLVGEIGVDVSPLLNRPNHERYVEAFRGKIRIWEDYAVFGFLIDRIGRYQLEEFIGCSYAPLDRVLPDVLKEEEGHIDHGTTKTAELAAKGGEQKERVQKSVNYWYPKALDMFGSSSSRRSERYRYWRLKRRTNAEAREEYIREVNPLIEAMGLEVPDPTVGRQFF